MTMHPELTTIRDFIRYAASQYNENGLYYGHGTDNAWDEAVALVLHTLHLAPSSSTAVADAHLTQAERTKLFELIELRVSKRIPTPYLTHEAWFCGLPFFVDERVLIPRSPIAELIESQFQPWIQESQVHHILDLCTGSGCIAIACAIAFPDAQVDASDISVEALAVAKINVAKHEVFDQVHLHEANLFAGLPAKKQYDIIVSNPPYVSQQEMDELPTEYRHEPALGLASGKEGLDAALTILRQAKQHLSPHGILVVEVGNSEVALADMLPEVPFTWVEFQNGGGGVFLLTAEQLEMITC